MPRQVGRPKKEDNRKTSGNPRGRPVTRTIVLDEPATHPQKGINMSEAHAKFGMDEPCRVILHWRDGYGTGTDEILCKSYSLTHGVVFLATKVGEQIVPLLNVRKFEVVRI